MNRIFAQVSPDQVEPVADAIIANMKSVLTSAIFQAHNARQAQK